MNDLGTFISVHRKLLTWEWFTDSVMVHFFIFCLLKANFKPKTWQSIDIKRGQFITSIANITAETGISTQQARTCIKRLISTSTITSEPTNKFTMITVIKYDSYQIQEMNSNKRTNKRPNKRTTNEQQTDNKRITTTNKDNTLNTDNTDNNKEEEAHPLQIFISENLPNVKKLKTQMTQKNCIDIIEKYGKELVKIKLENMENMNGFAKKYNSVNATLNNWCRMENERNNGKQKNGFHNVNDSHISEKFRFTEAEELERQKEYEKGTYRYDEKGVLK